jgi:hypothetical protein
MSTLKLKVLYVFFKLLLFVHTRTRKKGTPTSNP